MRGAVNLASVPSKVAYLKPPRPPLLVTGWPRLGARALNLSREGESTSSVLSNAACRHARQCSQMRSSNSTTYDVTCDKTVKLSTSSFWGPGLGTGSTLRCVILQPDFGCKANNVALSCDPDLPLCRHNEIGAVGSVLLSLLSIKGL